MTIVLHIGRQKQASGAETVPSLPNPTAQRIGEVDWSQLHPFFVGGGLLSSGANAPKLPVSDWRCKVAADVESRGSCMEVVRFDSHDVMAQT